MTPPAPHPGPASDGRPDLLELLPPGPHRHRLKLARGEPAEFFRPWDPGGNLLSQRRQWLEAASSRYAPSLPEAAPLIRETVELARAWGALSTADDESGAWTARRLGARLEPDLVWLERAPPGGSARVVAAAVCFPSSWAPETKLGLSLQSIHEIVPGLNPELGAAIDAFLARLRPGSAWLRANWGLSASPDLNQHPARGLPRLGSDIRPDRIWMRVEHQALVALPRTGAILFGIRLELLPLTALIRLPGMAPALAEALRALPEPLARYKGLAEVREPLANHLLGAAASSGF